MFYKIRNIKLFKYTNGKFKNLLLNYIRGHSLNTEANFRGILN